jgi:gluconate kinase
MGSRDHFMPVSLLQSQFETLERPEDALVLDATAAPAALTQQVLEHLRQL